MKEREKVRKTEKKRERVDTKEMPLGRGQCARLLTHTMHVGNIWAEGLSYVYVFHGQQLNMEQEAHAFVCQKLVQMQQTAEIYRSWMICHWCSSTSNFYVRFKITYHFNTTVVSHSHRRRFWGFFYVDKLYRLQRIALLSFGISNFFYSITDCKSLMIYFIKTLEHFIEVVLIFLGLPSEGRRR